YTPLFRSLRHALADPHILEAIINADHKRVLISTATCDALARFDLAVTPTSTRRHGHLEKVGLNFVIRNLAHWFDGLPIARIQRVLGAADGREAIHRAERHVRGAALG